MTTSKEKINSVMSGETPTARLAALLREWAYDAEEMELSEGATSLATWLVEHGVTLAGPAAAPDAVDMLAALKVIGIEPPEFPDEPWSILLTENGPEAGGETAEATAKIFMDDLTQREKRASPQGLKPRVEGGAGFVNDAPDDDAQMTAAWRAYKRYVSADLSDTGWLAMKAAIRAYLRAGAA